MACCLIVFNRWVAKRMQHFVQHDTAFFKNVLNMQNSPSPSQNDPSTSDSSPEDYKTIVKDCKTGKRTQVKNI